MKVDWSIIALTIGLVVSVAATVVVVITHGELAGTGLGALTATLASALVWRVRAKNGNSH